VTNRQVGLALSGGGATSAALVPFIQALQRAAIPLDVVGSFSGGAILGLYLATGRLPAYLDRWHGLRFSLMFPAAMCSSKVIQLVLNREFGNARLEDLDVRFVPMTVEVPGDGDPRPCAVVGGTLGEAVRVSGIGAGLIGPAERRGTRYLDGGVAFGVPAAVLPDFGADMVIAGNSIVPPHGRDLNAVLPWDVGRLLELNPFVDLWWSRMSDVFIGMLTTLRQAARQGAEDADVYYEVSPDETPFLEAFAWHALDRIRQTAENGRTWMPALDRSIDQWNELRGLETP
jgi:NTE family protein